jgi:nitroreductase
MPFDTIKNFGKGGVTIEKPTDYTAPVDCDTLLSIIKKRRSVRKYLNRDVPWEVIERILEASKYAPSAGNYQPWEYIIVKNNDVKKDIVQACFNQAWMLNAPVLIVACTNIRLAAAVYGERGSKLYGIQAVSASIENMLLTAQSMGLATCWVGAFSEVMVARLLSCPEYIRPCAIIALGYPEEEPKVPSRQSIQEFVHLENFGETLLSENVSKEKKPTYMKFK